MKFCSQLCNGDGHIDTWFVDIYIKSSIPWHFDPTHKSHKHFAFASYLALVPRNIRTQHWNQNLPTKRKNYLRLLAGNFTPTKILIFSFRLFLARERFHSSSEESLGSEQEAEAERELQRHTTMGKFAISPPFSIAIGAESISIGRSTNFFLFHQNARNWIRGSGWWRNK